MLLSSGAGLLATIAVLSSTRVAVATLDSKEGNRARWRGRASNPVGGVSRSRVGSTPAAFRQNYGLQPSKKAPYGAFFILVRGNTMVFLDH